MSAFKRFVFGSRAMLATLGLSLCLGGSAYAGSNATATSSLDFVGTGSLPGNGFDNGVVTGTVSGNGTVITVEVFANGLSTGIEGAEADFRFNPLVKITKVTPASIFTASLSFSDSTASVGSLSGPLTTNDGYLMTVEFTTQTDVTNIPFTIAIKNLTVRASSTDVDTLKTGTIIFNPGALPPPPFFTPTPVMLVNSGFSASAGDVRLFEGKQIAGQVFSLGQSSLIDDIQVLIKPLTDHDHLTTYLTTVNVADTTVSVLDTLAVFFTPLPPPAGAFVYQTVGFGPGTTILPKGEYGLVFTTTNGDSAGPSIGLTSISAGPSGVSTGSDVNPTSPWLSTFQGLGPDDVGLGIRVIGEPVTSKLAVSEGYVNMGDVPIDNIDGRTLTFNIESLTSDLLLNTQLPGLSGSPTGPSAGGTLTDSLGVFSLPTAYSAALSGATSVQIEFKPTAQGVFKSTLLLVSNDSQLPLLPGGDTGGLEGNAHVMRIPLVGRGILRSNPAILLSQSSLDIRLAPGGAVSGSISLQSLPGGNSFSFNVETLVVGQPWLKVGISAGTVPQNGSVEIPLNFDASGLIDGNTYSAKLIFQSFDPIGKLELPVNLTVQSSTTVDGLVRYYDTPDTNAIGVSGVALVAPPDTLAIGETFTDGFYSITSLSGSQGLTTLAFNKPVDPSASGTPEHNAIQGTDAVAVLEKSAFVTQVSPDQAFAGDINGDGHLDNSDALGILRYLAFFPDNIGKTGRWAFRPAQITVTPGAKVPSVRAFLKGDVIPSYGRTPLAKPIVNGATASFDITAAAWQGDELVLPVRVAFGAPVKSLLVSLDYDATQLQYESAQLTSAAGKDYMMVSNGQEAGKVHIAMAGLPQSTINQPLLELKFKAVSDVEAAQRAEFLLSRFVINDLPMPVGPSSMLTVEKAPAEFLLAQNQPNPFNPETQIQFALPQASQVQLTIYNTLGQVVRVLIDKDLAAGVHKVVWDGRTASGAMAASGVYIYRIQTNNGFTDSKRMMLLK